MKQLWFKYASKIDALSRRERVIVFIAGVLIAVAVIFLLAIDPAQRRQRMLLVQMEQQRAEIAALATQGATGTKQVDPDAAIRAQGDALNQQIDTLDETLRAMQRDLVPADRMTPLLQDMVARDARLTLMSLRTLPAEPLVGRADQPAAGGSAAPQSVPPKGEIGAAHVFKHGVEITIQGGYASLHDYLMRLEQSPWRMFWWRARLIADEEAQLTLIVTMYTLSLDKAWLQV